MIKRLVKKAMAGLFVIVITAGAAMAQDTTGTLYIKGGSRLGWNSTTTETPSRESKSRAFSISPGLGAVIVPGLVGGANLNLFFESYEYVDGMAVARETKTNSFSIGPFLTYYFGSGIVRPYISADVGIGKSIYKTEGFENTDIKRFSYGGEVGLSYFITPSVVAGGGLRYDHSENHFENNDSFLNDSFGLNVSLGFFL